MLKTRENICRLGQKNKPNLKRKHPIGRYLFFTLDLDTLLIASQVNAS